MICVLLCPSQPAEAAEGFVGSTTKSCGSHLLHQFPGCRGREAAEDHQGKQLLILKAHAYSTKMRPVFVWIEAANMQGLCPFLISRKSLQISEVFYTIFDIQLFKVAVAPGQQRTLPIGRITT